MAGNQEQVQQGTGVAAGDSRYFGNKGLFVTCFVALVATSFAFIIRAFVVEAWQVDFALSETQKGQILGAGMWPFGVSIVLFSLIIDRIGYGKSLAFAFACHIVSTLTFLIAGGYWGLYWGSFLNGIAAGTVEAVINPVITTMYPKEKTKRLTLLHAGWSAGFVIAGILMLTVIADASWKVKVMLILIPTLAYGAMLLKCKFPVSERVSAGVPYKEMLAECGAIGALLVFYMIVMEFNNVFRASSFLGLSWAPVYEGAISLPSWPLLAVLVAIIVGFFAYSRSLGRAMYIFLLVIMILLAITELGTDAWIKELMRPAMTKIGLDSGWVLVYTATIMTILRFCIGPVEKRLKPLGVLLVSSLFAVAGLYLLASAQGVFILLWATIYGTGQCYFWPVTQGLVAEQFPKGGALTLNAIGGMGMLGVGIIGTQLLGFWQDSYIDQQMASKDAQAQVRMWTPAEQAKPSIFGGYRGLSQHYVNEVNDLTALYEYRRDQAASADDAMYQTLVRKAYNHLVRAEGDTSERSHEAMAASLEEKGLFIDQARYQELKTYQGEIDALTTAAKRKAMATVAILPLIMALCYIGLIFYFRAKGGYKPVDLAAPQAEEAA
ncbi:MAG: MFS transporter [Lentisphaeria bacterium]|nr:MFS transporter [Lentisphaeria bacterium]